MRPWRNLNPTGRTVHRSAAPLCMIAPLTIRRKLISCGILFLQDPLRAAKDAGVQHFIWSTLPDVEAISRGKLHVPHFTGKANVEQFVRKAGFANYTFAIVPLASRHAFVDREHNNCKLLFLFILLAFLCTSDTICPKYSANSCQKALFY